MWNDKFVRTGDPMDAMCAVMVAEQTELAIPAPIVRWLARSFNAWMAGEGKKSLDSIFGVRGKGRRPAYKKDLIRQRDEALFEHMGRLLSAGFTQAEAAAAVCAVLDNTLDWNRSSHSVVKPDADSVAHGYRYWPDRKAWEDFLSERLPFQDPERLRALISNILTDHVPDRYRPLLRRGLK